MATKEQKDRKKADYVNRRMQEMLRDTGQKKSTNNIWKTIGIIAGIAILLAIMIPVLSDSAELHRLKQEFSQCSWGAAGDKSGPNGKCIIKYGKDDEVHIYWERER